VYNYIQGGFFMALLTQMIHKRIGLVIAAVGTRIILILVSLWWNAQLSSIIDDINTNVSIRPYTISTAAMTILLSMLATYIGGICLAWTSETMAHDLRMGYANHFVNLHIIETDNLNAGEQTSKLQNEIDEAVNYIRGPVFTITDDIIRFAGTFIWLMYLNPELTLLSNIPLVFLMWYTAYSSKIIEKTALHSQQANTKLNGFTDTLISVFPIMRLFNASGLIQHKYNAALDLWEHASTKEGRKKAGLMSLSGFLSLIMLMLLFFMGGTQIYQGTLTLGCLYVFVNLSGNISGVMINMPGTIAGFRRFAVNMHRLRPTVKLIKREGCR
jgi:ABC-type multidrug transport system fused ATPase/permease subunit